MAKKLQTVLAAAAIAAFATAFGAVVSGVVTYQTLNRQTDVKLIEIAFGILKAKPDDNIRPARQWALEVISNFSTKVKLSEDAREALLQHQVLQCGPVGIVESVGEALPAIDRK